MTRRKSLALREPNGQTKRSMREPNLPSPGEVSRLRDAALAGLRDPIWGSTMGWLYLSGKLTAAQFQAGKRWAELVRDYSAACQSPKSPRSANLDPKGGSPIDPDSSKGLREARRHAQTLHRYVIALALLKLAGEPARRAVMDVCELGQMTAGRDDLEALRAGLDVLARFWGGARK